MLSLGKVVIFLLQSNKRSDHKRTITKLIHTNALIKMLKNAKSFKMLSNEAKCA